MTKRFRPACARIALAPDVIDLEIGYFGVPALPVREVRVTPHLYTSAAEIDLLISAIRALAEICTTALQKS